MTSKITDTTTVGLQNDQFSTLKTTEKPPEQSPGSHLTLETTVDDPTLKSNEKRSNLLDPSYKDTLLSNRKSDRSKSTFIVQKDTYDGADAIFDNDTVRQPIWTGLVAFEYAISKNRSQGALNWARTDIISGIVVRSE